MRAVHYRMIRYAYMGVIMLLILFAIKTYRDLQQLRTAPVILPRFYFYVADQTPGGNVVVQARGTWTTADGGQPPGTLTTTSLECRKVKMQCLESMASVSVSDQGFMEATPTVFEVLRWDDKEIVTKPVEGKCASRTLLFNLANKSVSNVIAITDKDVPCKDVPQTLRLESGIKR